MTLAERCDSEVSRITLRWQIEAIVEIDSSDKYKDVDVISVGAAATIASATLKLELLTWREIPRRPGAL